MPDLVGNTEDGQDLGPEVRNRASDPVVSARIKADIIARLPKIRSVVTGLHTDWSACFDCWNQTQRVRLYEGASDIYMPVARNIVETFISQIKGGVFPTTHRFLVEASPLAPGPSPEAVGALLKHCAEQAQIERYIEMAIRHALIYGTCIVKFPWLERTRTIYRRRSLLPPELAPMVAPEVMRAAKTIVPEVVKTYNGPAFVPVDPFRFYVHPVTCRDLDDAEMVFEDLDVSYYHLKCMETAGIYFDVQRLKESGNRPRQDTDTERNARIAKYGVTVDGMRAGSNQQAGLFGDQYTISEIWCKYDLDGTGYEIPCKIVVAGDYVLEARPNPFFNPRPPYRAWKVIDLDDLFFGQGIITGLKHQNYVVNALTNQGVDSAVYQSNPIVIADALGLAQGMGSIKLGHKSIIYVNGKPNEHIEFVKIPDTSSTAFNTVSLIIQAMRDMAGAPPILQGKLGANETTATEASILGNNAQSGVDNLIRSLEASILSPMLMDWYLLLQQKLDDGIWLEIAGEPKPVFMSAQELVGDYRFRWLVSTQVRDELSDLQQKLVAKALEAQTLGMSPLGASPGAPGGGPPEPGSLETPAEMGGQPMRPPMGR